MSLRVIAAAGIAVVAIGAVAVAWLQDAPEISAQEAVTAAEAALQQAGVEATVEPDPLLTTYTPQSDEPIDVWAVRATVRAEPIELRLATAGAHPIAIDDLAPDGASYILSELEYESVARSLDDPAHTRAIRRNISFTCAAVLVVALAIAHAALAANPKEAHR